MKGTAKEGRALVGDKLGDTRADTKKSKKGKVGRSSTMAQVAEEAKLLYGDMPATEGRSLRKRSAPPPAKLPAKKKAGAKKEGGTGKRGRPRKNVEKKEEKKEEENNKDSEEEEKEEDEEEEDEN
eukprot:GHVO01042532.1.p1 GENE.GHVO01042532.1~~GHVO01042532.1.p1  ORF type:complete len:125 (+),score=37.88 GHVO01042532.1:167-541(+)